MGRGGGALVRGGRGAGYFGGPQRGFYRGRGGGERPGEAVGRAETSGGALSRGGRLRKRR
jgi:hypothetical protein